MAASGRLAGRGGLRPRRPHHWARAFEPLGHTVKSIPARAVNPCLKVSEADWHDPETIGAATARAHRPAVAVKREAQRALQAYHRARSGLVKQRAARGNAVRAALAGCGRVSPRGAPTLRRAVHAAVSDDT